MFERVTDDKILKQLNSDNDKYEKVIDENLLKQLNSETQKFPIPELNLQNQKSGLDLIKSGLLGAGKGVENIRNLTRRFKGLPQQQDNESLRELINANKNPDFLESGIESAIQYAPLGVAGAFGIPAGIAGGALYGATQEPENLGIGALEGGALGSIPLLGQLTKKLNPMRLNSINIAKEVLEAEKKAKGVYSGETGKYSNLFKEAREKGVGKFEDLDRDKLNIDTLYKYTPNASKKLESLTEFRSNPTLENAQKSLSELGHITRELGKKTSLPPFQKKQYDAAKEAEKEIKDNMFKNNKGEINTDLMSEHAKIQHGYKEEVIPYSTNKDIKKFKEGEITAKELIDKLSKKRKISEKHKIIGFKKELLPKLGIGAAVGLTGKTAYDLINQLLEKGK